MSRCVLSRYKKIVSDLPQWKTIFQALDNVPEDQRNPIVDRIFSRYPQTQIAGTPKTPPSSRMQETAVVQTPPSPTHSQLWLSGSVVKSPQLPISCHQNSSSQVQDGATGVEAEVYSAIEVETNEIAEVGNAKEFDVQDKAEETRREDDEAEEFEDEGDDEDHDTENQNTRRFEPNGTQNARVIYDAQLDEAGSPESSGASSSLNSESEEGNNTFSSISKDSCRSQYSRKAPTLTIRE